jgi:hypothetical protein
MSDDPNAADHEAVEVTVKHLADGADGPGWYAWESEYPEEGYFWVSQTRSTAADLKTVHPGYVEKAVRP